MAYFPFMIDIEGKNCLVAGGGKIALHKVKILVKFGVRIKVVATEICEELFQFPCAFQKREFEDGDIEGMDFVVAATDDEELNLYISKLCRQKNILINSVDMKDACSFIFPAIIQDKDLLVAVSTGGQSPAAAAYVKQTIQREIPGYYGEMIEQLGDYRKLVLETVDTSEKRKQVFNRLLEYGDNNSGIINEKKVFEMISEVMNQKEIRIGTRGSELALAQTKQVVGLLNAEYPDLVFETVIIRTKGDKILEKPLIDFGGKGAFVTEFEEALLQGEIDLAVHSAKDMPMELSDGLEIAGVLPRENARDVLVCRKGDTKPIRIGTGSLRRQFQLKRIYPELECVAIRGNVPTRLDKVREGIYDGVILAAAGLARLDLLSEPDLEYHFFSYDEMIPAGGQGIIAIEGRTEDVISRMVKRISDFNAMMELETERKVLELLNADCHEAVGVFSEWKEDCMKLRVVREKEGQIFKAEKSCIPGKHFEMIKSLVHEMNKKE